MWFIGFIGQMHLLGELKEKNLKVPLYLNFLWGFFIFYFLIGNKTFIEKN